MLYKVIMTDMFFKEPPRVVLTGFLKLPWIRLWGSNANLVISCRKSKYWRNDHRSDKHEFFSSFYCLSSRFWKENVNILLVWLLRSDSLFSTIPLRESFSSCAVMVLQWWWHFLWGWDNGLFNVSFLFFHLKITCTLRIHFPLFRTPLSHLMQILWHYL